MPQFQITAWWNVIRQAADRIEADSPEAALAELKRQVEEGHFLEHNEECDNSDGPTNLEVWAMAPSPYGGGRFLMADKVVAEDLSEEERLNRAAPDLLAIAKFALSFASGGFDSVTFDDEMPDGRTFEQALTDAIDKAEGAASEDADKPAPRHGP